MYRTLLVPLDGSAFSERALPMAGALARQLGARVVLTRVASAAVFPGADATGVQVQAVREAQAYLDGLAAEMQRRGLSVEVGVPYGDAAESIVLEIGVHGADLVIMCTHGRSGLGRWIYGSVAEQVLAHSPVPVLLVHPTGEQSTLALRPGQAAVLVPLDGSAFAETALPHAMALARACGGEIVLLNVVELPVTVYAGPEVIPVVRSLPELQAEVEAYLAGMAQRVRGEGLVARAVVCEGWAPDAIASQAAALGASLIVMATHGRTGIVRMLLGSVALQVVRRSSVPVLLVRPTQAPAEIS